MNTKGELLIENFKRAVRQLAWAKGNAETLDTVYKYHDAAIDAEIELLSYVQKLERQGN